MTFENPFFAAALGIVVGLYVLDLVAALLNLSALRPKLPERFRGLYDEDKYARSQRYTRATTKFELAESAFFLAVFIAFWLAGGFGWLDAAARGLGFGPIVTGLAALSALWLAWTVLALPWDIADTFVIEEKFGFNKTSPATFAADRIKGLVLAALIGLPLAALVLWIFRTVDHAWLWAWAAVSGISLVLAYLSPRLILPLFNKFTPLEDDALNRDIRALADKCRFPLDEVTVMDGSKRSAKANAFFTGFGRHKKIALFDTLVDAHPSDELVAILAHEIGHFKKRHIIQMLAASIAQTGIVFFLLSLVLENDAFFAAFGVDTPSVYLGFIFFGILYRPVGRLLSVAMAVLSRKNEFEADAYAAEVTGSPDPLAAALRKLSADNLTNLTPHPFYVFLNYSHPPLAQRLDALARRRDVNKT